MHLGKILKIAVSSCIYKIISHYFALEMTKKYYYKTSGRISPGKERKFIDSI